MSLNILDKFVHFLEAGFIEYKLFFFDMSTKSIFEILKRAIDLLTIEGRL